MRWFSSPVRYEEPVFRPPSEADSLILQATYGCSNLKTERDDASPTGWRVRRGCAFCSMYQTKPFRVRPEGELLAEIDGAARALPRTRRIFLADGDALVLSTDRLLRILGRLRERFAALDRVTAYATPQNLLRKTVADLRRIRGAGLTMVYLGVESGDDEVLRRIDKGATAAEIVEGGRRAREAGVAVSATVILGLAGPEGSARHAEATARVIDGFAPEYASALTLMLAPRFPDFPTATEFPGWRPLDPAEALEECRRLLAATTCDGVEFRSNHASNWLALKGRLARDRPRLLREIDAALADPRRLRPEAWRGL